MISFIYSSGERCYDEFWSGDYCTEVNEVMKKRYGPSIKVGAFHLGSDGVNVANNIAKPRKEVCYVIYICLYFPPLPMNSNL